MKEKLLALLVAKFKGVPEAILERIATKKAGSVTDEAQLQSVADGIDYGQIVQSDVDSRITESNKKAIQNYELTHKLKDGKPVDPNPNPDPNPTPKPGEKDDISKKITEAVAAAVKPLQDQLSSITSGKTNESRKAALETKLKDDKFKDIPQKTKDKILKDFNRMSFEKDEDFDTFLQETEEEMTGINQELADIGLNQQGRPVIGQQTNKDGVSKATQDYIDSKKTENNPLAGKDLTTKK